MTIKMSSTAGAAMAGLSRAQIALLATVGVVGLGGSGALVHHLVAKQPAPAAMPVSQQEAKLAENVNERRARAEADGRKLRQQDLGQGYQFDPSGNLLAAAPDGAGLPQNRFSAAPGGHGGGASTQVTAAIGRGIEPSTHDDEYDDEGGGSETRHGGRARDDDGDERAAGDGTRPVLTASMLGYSTVPGAAWAARRPDRPAAAGASPKRGGEGAGAGDQGEVVDRATAAMEDSTRALERAIHSRAQEDIGGDRGTQARPAPGTIGMWGPSVAISHGPSGAGESLYAEEKPATRSAQSFSAGSTGDMTIGGGVGPDLIVRQGKFLDCAVVNEIRADLVDSPVIAMVSRDFVSLDGKYVLIPAGSKLLGEAGRTQNLQQERVYIKFDRILFPDQRSAYFPTRKVSAVDEVGAVGVGGDVDRHLMMQFGAAIMLGVLDGLGAAVQSPSSGSDPTVRDLILARTSSDFSTVLAGVIQKYANVVPTITVAAGSKMKVFFAEDVRLSPYGLTADLSWVREAR